MKKELYVFAGPNGSGKSSIINEFRSQVSAPEYYICPDNIVREICKRYPDLALYDAYIRAMQLAEQTRQRLVERGESFMFETVFSNMEKLKFLRFAKAHGFKIYVTYVTTSDPSINLRRVRRRVSEGGHDVPEDKIKSRYERSMALMAEVAAFADEAEIYDNSIDEAAPQLVFKKYPDGTMFANSGKAWVTRYLNEPLTNMGYVINELPKQ